MSIQEFPIFNYYDQQRFKQFSPQDCANWYVTESPTGKKKKALYPTMGRRHIRRGNQNLLIFGLQPRAIFKSINFMYVVVSNVIYQVNAFFTQRVVSIPAFTQTSGRLDFDFLPVVQSPSPSPNPNQKVFCMFVDGQNIFVLDESTGVMTVVTDTLAPINPTVVVAFGNRFAVASLNSTQFSLSAINLGGVYDPTMCFHIAGAAVFAQETGIIRAMEVLHNNLYMFTDYTTGIWSNTPGQFDNASFPWKKNSSYDWDYGIADVNSIDVDFGRIVWLARNKNGLISFMATNGQMPEAISTQAINVLLQDSDNIAGPNPFLTQNVYGFLYQYEDSIFYRASVGQYDNFGILDVTTQSSSIEFNFDSKTWHRCIELNGERNRIQSHTFFNSIHIVNVINDPALYEMAGNIYTNEIKNPNPAITNPQDPFYFIAYPFRYENVTQIIAQDDYSEFKTNYVEIDFVWGQQTQVKSSAPQQNTVFLVSELSTDDNPIYLVAEDGSTFLIAEGSDVPMPTSNIYNNIFIPHIELYISDDGGISFYSADVREFSQLGQYQWRMRWYQLGTSRNRCYRLVCVSAAPIVVLGAVMEVVRSSGGAN